METQRGLSTIFGCAERLNAAAAQNPLQEQHRLVWPRKRELQRANAISQLQHNLAMDTCTRSIAQWQQVLNSLLFNYDTHTC